MSHARQWITTISLYSSRYEKCRMPVTQCRTVTSLDVTDSLHSSWYEETINHAMSHARQRIITSSLYSSRHEEMSHAQWHNIARPHHWTLPDSPRGFFVCEQTHTNKLLTSLSLTSTTFILTDVGRLVTSAKEVMFSSLFVCLSVSNFVQKSYETELHEILREGWQ